MSNKRHGGKREGAGRKPSPFVSKRIVIHIKSQLEIDGILEALTPRERTEALIQYIDNLPQGVQTYYGPNFKNKIEGLPN